MNKTLYRNRYRMAAEILSETRNLINTKRKTLELAERESERLLKRNKLNELQKHLANIEKRLDVLQDLKYKVQKLMISESEESKATDEFTTKIEDDMARFDGVVSELEKSVKRLNDGEQARTRSKVDQEQEENFGRIYEKEMRLEVMRMEMKKKHGDSEGKKSASESNKVKLPKLVISKFEGTTSDWFCFWNQLETKIDKQDVSPVTKFSYLKEILFAQVRKLIDGLPFTPEGYSRAKSILVSTYNKPKVVANAHIKCITSLPIITSTYPSRVHEFYEKLIVSTQALDSMSKLKDINGYVKITLDRLPGIRADLVRLDDDWQDWEFTQLVEALRKWTEHNPKIFVPPDKNQKRDKMYYTRENEQKSRVCVYCDKEGHKSSKCKTVTKVSGRRSILSQKRLCFNCTGSKQGFRKSKYKNMSDLQRELPHLNM